MSASSSLLPQIRIVGVIRIYSMKVNSLLLVLVTQGLEVPIDGSPTPGVEFSFSSKDFRSKQLLAALTLQLACLPAGIFAC